MLYGFIRSPELGWLPGFPVAKRWIKLLQSVLKSQRKNTQDTAERPVVFYRQKKKIKKAEVLNQKCSSESPLPLFYLKELHEAHVQDVDRNGGHH